jgi:predicted HTH transcriptional regulator
LRILAVRSIAPLALLIGVDDEGEVLGLEVDYASLDGNRDEFELHLRSLVNKSLGAAFAATNLAITFPAVDDKEVCIIEVKRANEPQYINVKDKSNSPVDKFYVRSGNSSIELQRKEIAPYIQARFY